MEEEFLPLKALHFGRVVKHVKFYDKVICKKSVGETQKAKDFTPAIEEILDAET